MVCDTQKETRGIVPKKHESKGSLCVVEGTKKSDSISKPNFGVVPIKNSFKVVMEQTEEWMLVGCCG